MTDSSTGELLKSDTSKVIIPVSFLRDANAKLVERLYLIKVVAQKDSIINLNKLYNAEQAKVIKDFQGRVVTVTDENNKLKLAVNKQKNIGKIFKNTTLLAITGVIALIVIR